MNQQTSMKSDYSDGFNVDLAELIGILWSYKRSIIGFSTLVFLSSIIIALSLTEYYRSESILITRDSQDASGLSQYSGLASLAGVSIPGSGGNVSAEMIAVIKSRQFTNHLLQFEDVLPSIMASKSYDKKTQQIQYDSDIYDSETKEWITKPSYLKAHKKILRDVLNITEDKLTGFITIRVEHLSPVFAKEFLTLIITEANNLKRKKDIESSEKALSYLKMELSKTSLIEIKESISQLIEAQLERKMMANIHEEYTLTTAEPPFIPEDKSKPSRSLIIFLTTFFGVMFCTGIILVKHFYFSKQTTP